MALCGTFQQSASWVWGRIVDCHNLGAPFNEETITESVLYWQVKHHQRDVRCVQFNKHREAQTGADWEWWFVSGAKGVSFRVQAKRLRLPQEEYEGVWRTIGQSNVLQIDQLIDRAKAREHIPAYCFYNGSLKTQFASLATACGKHLSSPPTELGCTIVHAHAVRALGPSVQDFSTITAQGVPWECLVCCSCGAAGASLPDKVISTTRTRFSGVSGGDQIAADLPEAPAPVPDYVQLTLKVRPEELPFIAGDVAGMARVDEDLVGLAVFSEN